jgi:hypothetical protein
VRLFFERWQGTLPSPLTNEDRARGYGHALAFGQLEISDTRVFDRPAAGRAWFEQTLPGQLTLGRPDQAAATDAARLQELSAEYRALAAQRTALEERWLVLSEQLEA